MRLQSWRKTENLERVGVAVDVFFIPALGQEFHPAPTHLFIPLRDGCVQMLNTRGAKLKLLRRDGPMAVNHARGNVAGVLHGGGVTFGGFAGEGQGDQVRKRTAAQLPDVTDHA